MKQGATAAVRVYLPFHLRTLAQAQGELTFDVEPPVTLRAVLGAIEARYPMLKGTIRDQVTEQRRPFLRFFACDQDFSNHSPDEPLPDAIVNGSETLLIIGALAGG